VHDPLLLPAEKRPLWHCWHRALPDTEKLPGAQSLQTVALFAARPLAFDAVPAAQSRQTAALAEECVPVEQSRHAEEPGAEYRPARHSLQKPASATPVRL